MNPATLQSVLADLVQKLGDAGQKYGPDAVNLTAQYLHYRAILYLGVGVFWLIITGLLAWFTKSNWYWYSRWQETNECDGPSECPYLWFSLMFAIITAFLALVSFSYLLYIPTWIAAVSPKLALVQMAVQAVTKQ